MIARWAFLGLVALLFVSGQLQVWWTPEPSRRVGCRGRRPGHRSPALGASLAASGAAGRPGRRRRSSATRRRSWPGLVRDPARGLRPGVLGVREGLGDRHVDGGAGHPGHRHPPAAARCRGRRRRPRLGDPRRHLGAGAVDAPPPVRARLPGRPQLRAGAGPGGGQPCRRRLRARQDRPRAPRPGGPQHGGDRAAGAGGQPGASGGCRGGPTLAGRHRVGRSRRDGRAAAAARRAPRRGGGRRARGAAEPRAARRPRGAGQGGRAGGDGRRRRNARTATPGPGPLGVPHRAGGSDQRPQARRAGAHQRAGRLRRRRP